MAFVIFDRFILIQFRPQKYKNFHNSKIQFFLTFAAVMKRSTNHMCKSILATVLFVILNLANAEMYGQMDTSKVKWKEPKFILPDEEHWVEDGDGIVCVSCYSATNEFKYGPHATHIKRKKWKVMWGIDTTIYNDYYYGRFKKKAATQFVRDNFQCDYEYADKTRSGLVWTVKIYSKSGKLLEVHKRILIGYYSKIVRRPVLDRHRTSEF